MRTGSPLAGKSRLGTAPRGARSESVDTLRCRRKGRVEVFACGDEDGTRPVDEVGTGVG